MIINNCWIWYCSLLSLQSDFKKSWLHTQLSAQAPACQHWDMIMRNLSNSQTSGLKNKWHLWFWMWPETQNASADLHPPSKNLCPEAIPKEQHKGFWCRTAWVQCLSSGWFLIKVIFLWGLGMGKSMQLEWQLGWVKCWANRQMDGARYCGIFWG